MSHSSSRSASFRRPLAWLVSVALALGTISLTGQTATAEPTPGTGVLTWERGEAWTARESKPILWVYLSWDPSWSTDDLSSATVSVTEGAGGDELCGYNQWSDWYSDDSRKVFYCELAASLSEGLHDLTAVVSIDGVPGGLFGPAVSRVTVDTSGVLHWGTDMEWTPQTQRPVFSAYTTIGVDGSRFTAADAATAKVTFVEETLETLDEETWTTDWTVYCEDVEADVVDGVATWTCQADSDVAYGRHYRTLAVLNWEGSSSGTGYDDRLRCDDLRIAYPAGTLTWEHGTEWETTDLVTHLNFDFSWDPSWGAGFANTATVSVTEGLDGEDLCSYKNWSTLVGVYTAYECVLAQPLYDGVHHLYASVVAADGDEYVSEESVVTVDTVGRLRWGTDMAWTQGTQRPVFSAYTTIGVDGSRFTAADAATAKVTFVEETLDEETWTTDWTVYCEDVEADVVDGVATWTCQADSDVAYGSHGQTTAVLNWEGSSSGTGYEDILWGSYLNIAYPAGTLTWQNGTEWRTSFSSPSLYFDLGWDPGWSADYLSSATVSVKEGVDGGELCGYSNGWLSSELTAQLYCGLYSGLSDGVHELTAVVSIEGVPGTPFGPGVSQVTVDTSGTVQWASDQVWVWQTPRPTFTAFTTIGSGFSAEAAANAKVAFYEESWDSETWTTQRTVYCEDLEADITTVPGVATFTCEASEDLGYGDHGPIYATLTLKDGTESSYPRTDGQYLQISPPAGTLTWQNGTEWETTDVVTGFWFTLGWDPSWGSVWGASVTVSVKEGVDGDELCDYSYPGPGSEFTAQLYCASYSGLSHGVHELTALVSVDGVPGSPFGPAVSQVTVDASGKLRWSTDQEWAQATRHPVFSVYTTLGANFTAADVEDSKVVFGGISGSYYEYADWTVYCEAAGVLEGDLVVFSCPSTVAVNPGVYDVNRMDKGTFAVLNPLGQHLSDGYGHFTWGEALSIGLPPGELAWEKGPAWSTQDSVYGVWLGVGPESGWTLPDDLASAVVSITEDGNELCNSTYGDTYTVGRFYCGLKQPLPHGTHTLSATVTVGGNTYGPEDSTVTVDLSGSVYWGADYKAVQYVQPVTFSAYAPIGANLNPVDAALATVTFVQNTQDEDGNTVWLPFCVADAVVAGDIATFTCNPSETVPLGNYPQVYAVLDWTSDDTWSNYRAYVPGALKVVADPLVVTVTSDPITLIYAAQYAIGNPLAPVVEIEVAGLTVGKNYAAALVDPYYGLGDELSVMAGCGGRPLVCSAFPRESATSVVEADSGTMTFSIPFSSHYNWFDPTSDYNAVVVEVTGENLGLFNPSEIIEADPDGGFGSFPTATVLGLAPAPIIWKQVSGLISVEETATISGVTAHSADVSIDYTIDSSIWGDIAQVCGTASIYRMFSFTRLAGQDSYVGDISAHDREGNSRLWDCLGGVRDDDTSPEAEALRAQYMRVNKVLSSNDPSYAAGSWYEQWYYIGQTKNADELDSSDTIVVPLLGLLDATDYGNWYLSKTGNAYATEKVGEFYRWVHYPVQELADTTAIGDTVTDPAAMLLAGITVIFNDGAVYRLAPGKEAVVDDFTTSSFDQNVENDYPDEEEVIKAAEESALEVTATAEDIYVPGEESKIILDNVPDECKQTISESIFCFWVGYIYSTPKRLTSVDGGDHLVVKWELGEGGDGTYYTTALIPTDVDEGPHTLALFDGAGELKAVAYLSDVTPDPVVIGSVTVTGTAEVGETLTAVAGGVDPAGATLTYKWLRDGEAIDGATDETYQLVAADAGTSVSVTVTASAFGYSSASKTSDAVSVASMPDTTPPSLSSGLASRTSASAASVSFTTSEAGSYYYVVSDTVPADADAVKTAWSGGVVSVGAGETTITLTGLTGAATTIYVVVEDLADNLSDVLSVNIPAWTPPPAWIGSVFLVPSNPLVGETLQPTITSYDPSDAKLTYQWLRNDVEIDGATGQTYNLVAADGGTSISVRVTASAVGYASVSKTSGGVNVRVPYYLTVIGGSGSGTRIAGEPVSIVANAAPAGQQFDKWVVTGAGSVASVTSASTTFTMPAANATVTATYKVKPSSAKDITKFTVAGVDATIAGSSIAVTVPYGTDVKKLTPTIVVSAGASVSPSGALDFSKPVTFTVKAADGSTKTYTVTVTVAPAPKYSLTVTGGSGSGSYAAGAVVPIKANDAPAGQQFDKWVVTGAGSVASVASASTTFTMPASVVTVKATYKAKPSSAKDITKFTVAGVSVVPSGSSIAVTVPSGTDVKKLTPTIVVSTGASVSPTGAQDFSKPVTFTVKAADGSTKTYAVTVTVDLVTPDTSDAAPLYRFYNWDSGTHFYTPDEAEKTGVVDRWDHDSGKGPFSLDGVVGRVVSSKVATEADQVVVYRFYMPATGTHFYSSDPAEVELVRSSWPDVFSYEGPAYVAYARNADASGCSVPGSIAYYRFYNNDAGVHFYTADETERDSVIDRWDYASGKGPFSLDGIAYCILPK